MDDIHINQIEKNIMEKYENVNAMRVCDSIESNIIRDQMMKILSEKHNNEMILQNEREKNRKLNEIIIDSECKNHIKTENSFQEFKDQKYKYEKNVEILHSQNMALQNHMRVLEKENIKLNIEITQNVQKLKEYDSFVNEFKGESHNLRIKFNTVNGEINRFKGIVNDLNKTVQNAIDENMQWKHVYEMECHKLQVCQNECDALRKGFEEFQSNAAKNLKESDSKSIELNKENVMMKEQIKVMEKRMKEMVEENEHLRSAFTATNDDIHQLIQNLPDD